MSQRDLENELTAQYDEKVRAFEDAVATATRISHASGGRQASAKVGWASVLFTRLCVISVSILKLTPRSSHFSERIDNWDFGSIAALVRMLMECVLTLFYLCIEEVPEEEWNARINVMNLRDNISRRQMFLAWEPKTDVSGYDKHTQDLHNRLLKNSFFMSLSEKRRKRLLKGESALILTHDEIVERMGDDLSSFRGMYKFLSASVHTTPMAFYRMGEQNRGRGLENPVEKGYIAFCLDIATRYVVRASGQITELLPDLKHLPK